MVMSTKQDSKPDIEQLRKIDGVGVATMRRIRESEDYNTVSDIATANPYEFREITNLNYATILHIRSQIRNGDLL